MITAYSFCMNSLMSFLDNTEYADNTAHSPERLAQVTDVDVYRYLANKAFGTPEPSEDDLPDRCRSTIINSIRRQFLTSCLDGARCGMRFERRGILQRAKPSMI